MISPIAKDFPVFVLKVQHDKKKKDFLADKVVAYATGVASSFMKHNEPELKAFQEETGITFSDDSFGPFFPIIKTHPVSSDRNRDWSQCLSDDDGFEIHFKKQLSPEQYSLVSDRIVSYMKNLGANTVSCNLFSFALNIDKIA